MITVYTTPNCQPCRMTKRALDQRGIPYMAYDITENHDAFAAVESLGYRELPVVVAGDDHWSGFRPDKLVALGGGE